MPPRTVRDPARPAAAVTPSLALLNLTAVALLAGMKSLEAIAQFARDHCLPFRLALGFTRLDSPCKATLANLFRLLDVEAYERALAAWLAARCPELGDALALDGKTLRGSASAAVPGVHLLALYAPKVSGIQAQIRVAGKTNEHKAALQLLGMVPLQGKVFPGDARFCHKDGCDKVLEGGGDYLWTVKDNQTQLHLDVAALFAESAAFSPYQQRRWESEQTRHTTHNKGHGRRERRTLTATPVLRDYLGARHPASVPDPPDPRVPGQDGAGDRLRDHESDTAGGRSGASAGVGTGPRGIENRLHGVRDVTLGEDACRVRSGAAPQVLAATRNAVIHLLEAVEAASKASALRRFAIYPGGSRLNRPGTRQLNGPDPPVYAGVFIQ
jgi:predicted transposase YbfD/YdcC